MLTELKHLYLKRILIAVHHKSIELDHCLDFFLDGSILNLDSFLPNILL